MQENKPKRCLDPIFKLCQDCRYGWVKYPGWIETRDDLEGCSFDCGCMYGLEKDEPTEEELKEFNDWCNRSR